MELMEDMIPLSETFRKKNEDPIAFIKRFGGIKRMYTILRKLAETLDEVHSAGFCYGDLNPNNVFISKDLDYTEVQLIDCDNMVFAADFDGRIYYPGYGAPELIKNQTNNMMTDTWSFAVLAFYLLRQELPFNGKMIQDAKTEKISIMEAKQNASELPWIDDPSGENENSSALPKEAMFRNPIYNLFDRTFGNDHNCYSRPILQEWIKELRKAEGAFFICGNSECQMTYLVQKSRTCPFCESKVPREYLIIVASQKFSAIDTDTKNIVKISIVKNKESKTVLNDRDVFTHIFWTGNKNIVASVTLSNQKAAIKFSEDIDISVYVNNEKKGIGQFKKDNERKLSLEKGKTYSLELPSFKPNYDFFYTDTESINTDSNTLKYNCTNVINFKLAE